MTLLTRPRSIDSGLSYVARGLLKWPCLKAWTAKIKSALFLGQLAGVRRSPVELNSRCWLSSARRALSQYWATVITDKSHTDETGAAYVSTNYWIFPIMPV
jgi:hypothetical protein